MDKEVAVNIAAWMAVAFFLMAFVKSALWFSDRIKGKDPKPPNDILEHGRRELERRVAAVESEVADLRRDLAHDRESAESSARSRSAGIYSKIDQVREEMLAKVDDLRIEVGQQFKDTERALGRIEGKLEKK